MGFRRRDIRSTFVTSYTSPPDCPSFFFFIYVIPRKIFHHSLRLFLLFLTPIPHGSLPTRLKSVHQSLHGGSLVVNSRPDFFHSLFGTPIDSLREGTSHLPSTVPGPHPPTDLQVNVLLVTPTSPHSLPLYRPLLQSLQSPCPVSQRTANGFRDRCIRTLVESPSFQFSSRPAKYETKVLDSWVEVFSHGPGRHV